MRPLKKESFLFKHSNKANPIIARCICNKKKKKKKHTTLLYLPKKTSLSEQPETNKNTKLEPLFHYDKTQQEQKKKREKRTWSSLSKALQLVLVRTLMVGLPIASIFSLSLSLSLSLSPTRKWKKERKPRKLFAFLSDPLR